MGKPHLEKYYKNGKLPNQTRKGSFWWRDTLKLLPDFKLFARPHVRNGESSLFWYDRWDNQPLSVAAPELFSFAKNSQLSVCKAFLEEDFANLFQLPLSQQAFLHIYARGLTEDAAAPSL